MENPDGDAMVSLSEIGMQVEKQVLGGGGEMIILTYICLNKGKVFCYLKFTT